MQRMLTYDDISEIIGDPEIRYLWMRYLKRDSEEDFTKYDNLFIKLKKVEKTNNFLSISLVGVGWIAFGFETGIAMSLLYYIGTKQRGT